MDWFAIMHGTIMAQPWVLSIGKGIVFPGEKDSHGFGHEGGCHMESKWLPSLTVPRTLRFRIEGLFSLDVLNRALQQARLAISKDMPHEINHHSRRRNV